MNSLLCDGRNRPLLPLSLSVTAKARTATIVEVSALPLLWRADAHRRDLPSRAKAAITGTTTGAGRMMKRPSLPSTRHWPLLRHRIAGACPGRREHLEMDRFRYDQTSGATAFSANASAGHRNHTSGSSPPSRLPPPSALFPHRQRPAPAASSFRGLSTWTATPRRLASRRGPRRKTFRKAV